MARIQRQYRRQAGRQAARQAHAEYLPQIKGARRSLHNEVGALRSQEAPLNAGLDKAIATIRSSNLSPTDKAQAIKDFAERQAEVPASIASQVLSAREGAAGTISDLRSEEAAQRGSILSQLLTAATQRQQEVQSEIAAEGRKSASDIKQAELEKALGLGSYSKTPTEEAQEKAELEKTRAETSKAREEAHGGGLTPYQQLERQESHHEDHATAAYWAKSFLEKGKAGEIQGVPPDPKEWSGETWNHLVGAVAKEGKVPVPAAERAVRAVQDHFEPAPADPFGIVGRAAGNAASALRSAPAGPSALLSMLGAPVSRHGRF